MRFVGQVYQRLLSALEPNQRLVVALLVLIPGLMYAPDPTLPCPGSPYPPQSFCCPGECKEEACYTIQNIPVCIYYCIPCQDGANRARIERSRPGAPKNPLEAYYSSAQHLARTEMLIEGRLIAKGQCPKKTQSPVTQIEPR